MIAPEIPMSTVYSIKRCSANETDGRQNIDFIAIYLRVPSTLEHPFQIT